MQPLVSIIIPVYNAESFARQALQSALAQTYSNIEVIVVNDGSTDRSPEVISEFNDPRIRFIQQRNRGGSAARNAGIERAKGEYIKFLDADDVLLHEAIERQVEQSKKLNENEIVFGDFNFINLEDAITAVNVFEETEDLTAEPETFFLSKWKILISCPLHRKEYLERIGGFDEKLSYGQESDLHFRLALNGVKFKYQAIPIFNYRSHCENSRISSIRIRKKREMWVMIYSLDKKIKLLEEKNGSLNPAQQDYFARSYFGLARKAFIRGNSAEGQYFLARSKQYSTNNFPPFRKGLVWGMVYQLAGSLIGYKNLEKLARQFRGGDVKASSELDVLFKQ